jgi:hypothetical protein
MTKFFAARNAGFWTGRQTHMPNVVRLAAGRSILLTPRFSGVMERPATKPTVSTVCPATILSSIWMIELSQATWPKFGINETIHNFVMRLQTRDENSL